VKTHQFYELLFRLLKDGWKARIEPHGGSIRLALPGSDEFGFCPLTAVCRTHLGKSLLVIQYREVGSALGLSEMAAWHIAMSADNHRTSEGFSFIVRDALLKTLRLA
jgi:hypothetical protein